MTSDAWDWLTKQQKRSIQDLVDLVNQGRTPTSATTSPSGTVNATEPVSTASVTVDPPEVVEARLNEWMMEVYGQPLKHNERPKRRRLTTQLVVEEMPRATRLDNINYKFADDPAFAALRAIANFVPGDGPWPNPRAIIMGEAPGADEDKHLKPFVGRSGHLLGSMMYECGLKRAEVYITNVVKYRPPANRTPTRDEIEAAVPHLRREVATVLPDGGVIITLGSVALDVVDQDLKIGKCHGKPFKRGLWTFVPMWHPSYVLQGRTPRAGYIEDWKRVKKVLK